MSNEFHVTINRGDSYLCRINGKEYILSNTKEGIEITLVTGYLVDRQGKRQAYNVDKLYTLNRIGEACLVNGIGFKLKPITNKAKLTISF